MADEKKARKPRTKPVIGQPETLDEMPETVREVTSRYDEIIDSIPVTGVLKLPIEAGSAASVAQALRNRCEKLGVTAEIKSGGNFVYARRV